MNTIQDRIKLVAWVAGADFRLLAITAMVVAVLLIITYRSPVLWLVPLAVIVQALAPQQARQAFALAMIEASAGNPEEIEVQRLAHNVALLTLMRGLLPGLGSELAPLDPDALPQAASGAAPLLRHALALREAWDQARAMWTTASP